MPVLPNAWVLKLKDMRKKKCRTPDPGSETDSEVSPDPGPFFPKPVIKNSFRKQSPNRVFSPVRPNDLAIVGTGELRCSSPVNHKAFDIPHPFASPAKNLMRTPSPRRTPSRTPPQPAKVSRYQRSPASIETGCTYKTTVNSFRRKPSDLEAAIGKKETLSAGSVRKVAPRVNLKSAKSRTRHASLDMENSDCFVDFEKCVKRVEKLSGRDKDEDPWSVELSKGALVKQQLFLKKKREAAAMKVVLKNQWGSPEMPPVLSQFQQKLAVCDPVSQWIAQTPEPAPVMRSFREAPNATENCIPRSLTASFRALASGGHTQVSEYEKPRPDSWGSCSSLGSDDEGSMFTTSFELPGLSKESSSRKNRWSTSDSSGVTSSAEMDRAIQNFNSLEDKALLTVDQAANMLTVGSRFVRDQAQDGLRNPLGPSCLSDVSEEFESKPSSNLVQLESDSGSFTRSTSPVKSIFPNSPAVCSQEATAKTWAQIDFPVFDDEAGPFDMTRETYYHGSLHPLEHTSLGTHVRREARRAKHLSDIEALANAQRISASRLKGNKSHVEARPRKTKSGESGHDKIVPTVTMKTLKTTKSFTRADCVEQVISQSQRHQRKFSKEEVMMPQEVNGVVKESVALIKNSYNPFGDFKESMIEMIVEKDIQESGDLEELLQCYLSLNAEEYHNVIVEVFTEVWREIFESNA